MIRVRITATALQERVHILDEMENILLLIVHKKWPQSRVISNIKPK